MTSGLNINISELIKRVLKYIIIFLLISIIVTAIFKHTPSLFEVISVGLATAMIVCLYDTYSPTTCFTCPSDAVAVCVKVNPE